MSNATMITLGLFRGLVLSGVHAPRFPKADSRSEAIRDPACLLAADLPGDCLADLIQQGQPLLATAGDPRLSVDPFCGVLSRAPRRAALAVQS